MSRRRFCRKFWCVDKEDARRRIVQIHIKRRRQREFDPSEDAKKYLRLEKGSGEKSSLLFVLATEPTRTPLKAGIRRV
jgi:hypothetical protein